MYPGVGQGNIYLGLDKGIYTWGRTREYKPGVGQGNVYTRSRIRDYIPGGRPGNIYLGKDKKYKPVV